MEEQENNVLEEKENETVNEKVAASASKKTNKKLVTTIAAGVAGVAVIAGVIVAVVAGGSKDDGKVQYAFNTMGGVEMSAIDVTVGEEFTLPTPQEREGYTFDGWYTSENFEGEPVKTVVAQANQTYYAKWTQLSKITLELEGGQLSATTLYLKAGASLYDFMKDYKPTKSGLTFGAWFNGNNELATNAKMPQDGVTLTAKYKASYTVEFYLQSLEDPTQYETEPFKVTTGNEYVDKNYVSSVTLSGCQENETYAGRVVAGTIQEDASKNVFKHYFDRKEFSVVFDTNYPVGTDEEVTFTKKFNESVTVPDEYSCEGYCLIGWASTDSAKVPEYEAYAVDKALEFNDGQIRESAKFTFDGSVGRLYGVWAKGYTDMFSSSDSLFFLDKTKAGEIDKSVIYLSRGNRFFKGEYDEDFNEFYFYTQGSDDVYLTGKLYENEKFAYTSVKRSQKIVYLYNVGEGLDKNIQLNFDETNGIKYIVGKDETVGTQQMNEEGEYVADFTQATSGELAGKKLTFLLGSYDNESAFIPLKEEERDFGALKRFYYDATTKELRTYQNGFGDITLDGYGNATYNSGSQVSTYYYSYEDEVITLTSRYGGLFGKALVQEHKGVKGYVLYTQWQNATLEVGEDTLKLDGGIKAVYTVDGVEINGYYTVTESLFGGYIIKVDTDDEQKFTFLLTNFELDEKGENLAESYGNINHVELVTNSYAEYRYLADGKIYNAAAIVVDEKDDGEGNKINWLTLYGFNSRLSEFVKVSDGEYVESDANEGYYYYEVENFYPCEGIITDPVNPSRVKSFVFALDSKTTAYNLFYWESSDSTDDPSVNKQYVTEYTCATSNTASLKLVGGFAYYTMEDGTTVSGAYAKNEEDDNYIVILTNSIATGSKNYYVELDEDNKTFVPLQYAPYTAYLYDVAGKLQDGEDDGVSLFFDGKGNAVYTKADGSKVEGTVVTSEDKTDGAAISIFTANDNSLTFEYISGLSLGNVSVFLQANDVYVGTYDYYVDGEQIGFLQLDGFGYYGEYMVNGVNYEGRYVIPEENVVELKAETGETFYFDIKTEKRITVRSEEYGEYLWIQNRDWQQETYFELNGYGKLSVYTKTEDTENSTEDEKVYVKNYIDQDGTYELFGDEYVLRYEANGAPKTLYGKLDNFYGSKAFVEKLDEEDYERVVGVYVNESDWSVLILDGFGNAIKYAGREDEDVEAGQKEVGYYTLITDNLLYFVNARNTDACLYDYNTEFRTATQVKFKDTKYLTDKMETLTFFKYGYLTVENNEGETERHFYQEVYEENGNTKTLVGLKIYVSDPDNLAANDYGFIVTEIANGYDDEMQMPFNDDPYYKNDADRVVFNRAEADKENYPINGSKFSGLTLFEVPTTVEFEVEGKIYFGADETSNEVDCMVVREKNEEDELVTYVTYDDYRFFVNLTYQGINDDLETTSSYTIESMEFHKIAYARNFLDTYAYYAGFGYKVDNTLGEIVIHGSYQPNGDAENILVDAKFLEDSTVKDSQGNLIDVKDATYTDHGVNETYGQHYEATFTAEDGNLYSLHFTVARHSSINAYAFNVLALTYVQTFGEETDEYQIKAERVTYSEYTSFEKGDLFNIELLKNGEVIEGELVKGRKDIIQVIDGNVIFVAREKDTESSKYVSATHYMISVVGDPVIENTDGTVEVPAYESVEIKSVKTIDEILYDVGSASKNFVEFAEDKPVIIYLGVEALVAVSTKVAENIPDNHQPTDGSQIKVAYEVTTATSGRRILVQVRELTVGEETQTYVYARELLE